MARKVRPLRTSITEGSKGSRVKAEQWRLHPGQDNWPEDFSSADVILPSGYFLRDHSTLSGHDQDNSIPHAPVQTFHKSAERQSPLRQSVAPAVHPCTSFSSMLGEHTISYDGHERMQYKTYDTRSPNEKGGIVQCNASKLFCSEAAFLTEHSAPGDVVVNVGSTGVQHVPLLAMMFPFLKFHIFGAQTKSMELWSSVTLKTCTIFDRQFGIDDAVGYRKKTRDHVLFICDIRSASKILKAGGKPSMTNEDVIRDLVSR